jgi:hypothetical protein
MKEQVFIIHGKECDIQEVFTQVQERFKGDILLCVSSLVEHLQTSEGVPHFDIENEDLSFDYHSREGVCFECVEDAPGTRVVDDLCEDCWNQDSHFQEIYEWWLVSPWMLRRLSEHNEPVVDLRDFNLNLWGRTTTGQGWSLDDVLIRIYLDIVKGKMEWRESGPTAGGKA